MADDRMKHDDLQKNMGAGDKGQGFGQQSPGRGGQDNPGQKQAGQQGGQQGGGQGGQKGTRNMDDKDEDFGGGKPGTQNRGGQNR
ncbi:MAG TPA: hypothetical protein VHS05_13175 [Pyrinomonadaceae bacterium]|jgi:hypothetical protein|nr:hypothetical protein [Pyrinomonadaceae bacterium]